MALWVDQYRPTSIKALSYHPELSTRLLALAHSDELPHLLVYGPSGAGKKTRVMCLLREIYGAGVEKIKLEHRTLKTATNRVIEITTLGSNYHIECNPSDAGTGDRFVIQEVIKEIASHVNIAATGANSQGAGSGSKVPFKIVILTEVDKLSKQAQAGLRRTMEKYSSQCRIILLCNSPSKVIEPLRSRCLGLRVPAPSHEDISQLLVSVARKAGCQCPVELAMKISAHCDRNLRRALLMLEAARVQNGGSQLVASMPVPLPDWEMYICKMARDILQEQSPSRLLQVRDMLYELLTNCIPADVIVQTLTREMMKSIDESLKHELAHWAAFYEHRVQMGSKEIFHLEAFVAKFMAVYKRWLVSMFG